MKKYLVLVAMLLAACGEKAKNENVAMEENGDIAAVEVKAEDGVFNLSMENNHEELNAKVGQEIALRLDANATTGYRWNFITFVSGEDAVEELEEGYIENEHPEGMVGVGGTAIYKVKFVKPTVAVITANYSRGEDVDQQPKDKDDFSVKVVVE